MQLLRSYLSVSKPTETKKYTKNQILRPDLFLFIQKKLKKYSF